MLNNFFNIFDPLMFNLPLNYIFMIIIILLIIKKKMWNNNFSWNNFLSKKIFYEIKFNNHIMNKTLTNTFINLMNLLLLINLTNLIPMMFYISTNIMFTLNMSFLFINTFFLFNIFNNKNIFFMNLTPKNTPLMLIPLINLIELTSFFIQILTLALRLMINMMLGHIIIILMNNFISISFYMMIELMIIFIQSYVFFILNLLNFNNMY